MHLKQSSLCCPSYCWLRPGRAAGWVQHGIYDRRLRLCGGASKLDTPGAVLLWGQPFRPFTRSSAQGACHGPAVTTPLRLGRDNAGCRHAAGSHRSHRSNCSDCGNCSHSSHCGNGCDCGYSSTRSNCARQCNSYNWCCWCEAAGNGSCGTAASSKASTGCSCRSAGCSTASTHGPASHTACCSTDSTSTDCICHY